MCDSDFTVWQTTEGVDTGEATANGSLRSIMWQLLGVFLCIYKLKTSKGAENTTYTHIQNILEVQRMPKGKTAAGFIFKIRTSTKQRQQ